MTALVKLTTTETKLFFRDPMNVGFGLGMTPVLLIILGLIPAFREPIPEAAGLRVIDFYTTIIVAMAIASMVLFVLAQLFVGHRQKGFCDACASRRSSRSRCWVPSC